jgi:hypothetical protein
VPARVRGASVRRESLLLQFKFIKQFASSTCCDITTRDTAPRYNTSIIGF